MSTDNAWLRYLLADADASCITAINSPDCCTNMLTTVLDVIAVCARADLTDADQLRHHVLLAIRDAASPNSAITGSDDNPTADAIQSLSSNAQALANTLEDISRHLIGQALTGQLTIDAGPYAHAPHDAVTAAAPALARGARAAHHLATAAAEACTALGLTAGTPTEPPTRLLHLA